MTTGPTLAEEITLPLYRTSGLFVIPPDNDYPFTVSWAVHHEGLRIIDATFSSQGLSCRSQPAYSDDTWYEAQPDTEAGTGDWVVDNFLRAVVDSRDDETAVEWEARVTRSWEIAASERNWRTVEIDIDSSPTVARALSINGQKLLRTRLPWGDLIIYPDEHCSASHLTLQRLTADELQVLLDDCNAKRPSSQ